ncbi:MAG: carbohydrate ABC transporter substrate-binding protein [Lachnospiraceae bacterium]
MKKMKRFFALLLVVPMVFSLFACGGKTGSSNEKGESQVLKVAALESAYGAEGWQKICEAFEAANPGVKVELTIDKKLEDVIRPGINAGEYPDVVHLATGREAGMTETFIKDKQMESLDDVLTMTVPGEEVTVEEKILTGFMDSNLTMPYNDGTTYMMPMFYTNAGLFYNQGLFEEKGWEVPTTWDEMWTLADAAKAENIALFAYPTPGYLDSFAYSLLNVIGGPEFFQSAMRYDEGVWDGEQMNTYYDIIEKLAEYTESTVPANANDENYIKNQQLILDNKALFMPNGDWVVGEMEDAPRADGFEWGFTAIPALNEGGDRYAVTWMEQCWMPTGAANKELGKKFMAYLYSDEAAKLFMDNGGAVQPVESVIDQIPEDRKTFYDIYSEGAKPALGSWASTEPIEGLTTYDVWFQPINSLVTGDKTIDQYKTDIVDASKRLSEKLL